MSGIEPLVIGLAAAGAAAGAGVSAIQAQKQNKAISRAKEAQRTAAGVQEKQVAAQTANERRQLLLRQQQIEGSTAVAAGASGIDLGDFSPLNRQIETDAGLNLDILNQNLANTIASITSSLGANISGLNAQKSDIGLSAASGGIGGFTTGLSIGTSLQGAEVAGIEAERLKATRLDAFNSQIRGFRGIGVGI